MTQVCVQIYILQFNNVGTTIGAKYIKLYFIK
jgi:hypothetical protein